MMMLLPELRIRNANDVFGSFMIMLQKQKKTFNQFGENPH